MWLIHIIKGIDIHLSVHSQCKFLQCIQNMNQLKTKNNAAFQDSIRNKIPSSEQVTYRQF